MLREATNVQPVMYTNTIDGKAQDMSHIGAVHNSSTQHHYHPVDMYRELQNLHADAKMEHPAGEKGITRSHTQVRMATPPLLSIVRMS